MQAVADSNMQAGSDVAFAGLAQTAHHDGRIEDSIEHLRKAISLAPDNADYHYALGRTYKLREQHDLAESAYREVLRLRPLSTDAWISLGILLRHLGRAVEAEQCHRQALQIEPQNFLALLNLGNALLSQEQFVQAADLTHDSRQWLEQTAKCFLEAIEQNPRCAEAHNNLGRVLLLLDPAKAPRHFRAALHLNPEYFEAAESLGRLMHDAGQFEEAAGALALAAKLRPGVPELQLTLAHAYRAARRLTEATAQYESVLRQNPDSSRAKAGLAATLADRGQYTRPRALYAQALAGDGDDPTTRFAYSLFLLRSGDFANGWPLYESRWRAGRTREPLERSFTQPLWQGESLAGKTLLICCEQGLGDEIMFSSVIPEILLEAEHCIIECDERLAPIFRRSFPTATVFAVDRQAKDWNRLLERSDDRVPGFDTWTLAGTLPVYRRLSVGSFPKHPGYLAADSARVQHWREKLSALGNGLKVGISWRGGTVLSRADLRSLTLEQLRPLLSSTGAHFVNLQYGDSRAELEGFPIHHFQDALDDYAETANLVGALDLVITVCTAVVHLGGALGRPVWVMAPSLAEWRYGHQDPSMIWYPSVRVFRQASAGAWTPVISQVTRNLQKLPRRGV